MSVPVPVEGACMCGQVRMRVSAPPMITMACHCTGCQKLSASAFSLSAMIQGAAFEIIKGEPIAGALHGPNPYMFCPNCKNWLFTRLSGPGLVNLRPTMFDVPAWSTPFIESMVREKLPWATTPAKYRFDGFPPPEQYGPLMAEYAASVGT